jgi:hypothetical protein
MILVWFLFGGFMKTNEEMLLEMTAELLGGSVNFYLNELDETVPLFEIFDSFR